MSLALFEHFVPTRLNEQADCLRRKEMDMANRIPHEVPRKTTIVFERHFDEDAVASSRGFV